MTTETDVTFEAWLGSYPVSTVMEAGVFIGVMATLENITAAERERVGTGK
jgi:hypothetical protein